MSIASLLTDIVADPKLSNYTRLQALSNLPEEQQREFAATWPTLPVERRRSIAAWLEELAEENVELNFEPIFVVLLDDPDPEVRQRAIDGLWESHDWSLVPRFIALLRHDPDPDVRAAAASALAKYELAVELDERKSRFGPEIDRALLECLANSTEAPHVRRRALEAISTRSLPEVPLAIIEARSSDIPELRLGAIYAMGRTCDERWLDDLLEALESSEPEVRFEALGALGELEAEAAVPNIAPLLEDEDTEVRLAAIDALGKIGGEEAKAILRRYADRPSPLQEAAIEALAEAEFRDNPLG
ncbi:MAG: HEAT repeat domain-containing protein [Chloroflexota bacterium]|nr:HEAT repeat domain-containing protein [Dehalococcoidia bacterium]MDW8254216.1 HEAT repeat domain-containing protein [Chloroflexota bacterium]